MTDDVKSYDLKQSQQDTDHFTKSIIWVEDNNTIT